MISGAGLRCCTWVGDDCMMLNNDVQSRAQSKTVRLVCLVYRRAGPIVVWRKEVVQDLGTESVLFRSWDWRRTKEQTCADLVTYQYP